MATPHPLEFLMLVENVDEKLKDRLRAVLTPQGRGAVAESPHFTFIICNLLMGKTPIEVQQLLEKEKKQLISPHVIRDYGMTYIPPDLIRPNLMLKYFEKMESLDELSILETATKMQMMRVTSIMDTPTVTVEEKENARREIDLLAKMAHTSLDAKIKTGRVKSVEPPPVARVLHEHEHKHSLDSRQAASVLHALKQIKRLGVVDVQVADGSEKHAG